MGLRVPEFGLGEPVFQACCLAHLLGRRALGVPEELPKNLSLQGDFGVAPEWEKLPALSFHGKNWGSSDMARYVYGSGAGWNSMN